MATACKATNLEHAVIRVYDTQTWQLFGQPLAGHSLTVTQIAFSPDDVHILSVSRDRTWRLFEKSEGRPCRRTYRTFQYLNCVADGYMPIAADKSHGRIIWDCAWAPEGDIFATASRDKTVGLGLPPQCRVHALNPSQIGQIMEATGSHRSEMDRCGNSPGWRSRYGSCFRI